MRKMSGLLVMAALIGGAAFAEDEKKEGKKGGEKLAKLLKQMDADGDGKVSKDEFTKFFEEKLKGKGERLAAILPRLFDRLDANKDGYLDKEELEKVAGSLGEGGGKLRELLKDKLKKKREE